MAEHNQNFTIACTATGQPQPKITWSKLGGDLPKGRSEVMNDALTIYQVRRNDGGIYTCKADNILGTATDMAQLMVFSPLRFKLRPPQELTPMAGSTVRLPCVAESDLRLTITWTKDGSLPPFESRILQNNTLVLNSIKISHKGSYTCRASNLLSTIETKVKIHSPVTLASCSEIRKHVSSVSGNYDIDPDGEGGLAPFTVYCDMTAKNGVGVTVISHDSESRTSVKGYESPGTYLRDVRYAKVRVSSPESHRIVNSLSSTSVTVHICLTTLTTINMDGGCHVILLR